MGACPWGCATNQSYIVSITGVYWSVWWHCSIVWSAATRWEFTIPYAQWLLPSHTACLIGIIQYLAVIFEIGNRISPFSALTTLHTTPLKYCSYPPESHTGRYFLLRHCISLNKRAGYGGIKWTSILVWLHWNYLGGLQNTWTLSAKNLNEIGLIVFEIWPGKVKSRGRDYSSRRIYSAKYGICPPLKAHFSQSKKW